MTGDLNGTEIHIDYAVTPEQWLFLLVHLFGHTVQWNVNAGAFELSRPQSPPVSEDCLPALMEYEREAAGYALRLLHEVGITDVDQWFADYAACDAAYLRHYYVSAEKREFLSFWQEGTAARSGAASAAIHTHRSIVPQRWRSDLIWEIENSQSDDVANPNGPSSFRR